MPFVNIFLKVSTIMLNLIKAIISKGIQAIASGLGGVAFFVGLYYAFLSDAQERFWIAGICLAIVCISLVIISFAIHKIYDDR